MSEERVFPSPGGHVTCIKEEGCRHVPGLSLRDYLAAHALNGFLSKLGLNAWGADDGRSIAECAYDVADAMLATRQK